MKIECLVRSLGAVVVLTAAVGCSSPDESGSTRDWAADYCPQPSGEDQTVAIDWVPFVVVDGITYSTNYSPGSVLGEEHVGDVVTSVRCRIKDIVFDLNSSRARVMPPTCRSVLRCTLSPGPR